MADIENKASEWAVEPMAKPTAEPTAEPPGEMPDEPLTERLLAELLDAPSIDAFVSTHESVERSLSDYLNQLLASKGLSRPRVIRAAGLNPTFGYQIFTGQRNPSRDKVLQLTLAMGCTLTETNRALQAAGHSALYCKSRRDAIIIFCIERGCDLHGTDEELYRFGERTVCE